MPFSLDNHDLRVTNAVLPEELRNITVVLIFRELAMRCTGFETATNEELHLALYRAVNEMVHRMYVRISLSNGVGSL